MTIQTETPPALLQIEKILELTHDLSFKAGEFILEEGKENPYFYIILDGEVEISKKTTEGQRKVIAHLKPGEFFGEGALSGHLEKPASARALTELKVMTLAYADFKTLIDREPLSAVDFLQTVLKTVSNRLNSTNTKLLALYEINQLMGMYRDDLQNLSRAIIDRLAAITESRGGILVLKNPFSEDYRVVYSTGGFDESVFEKVEDKEARITRIGKEQWMVISLKGLGCMGLWREEHEHHFEDEQLRLVALVADQAGNTIESAFRRASDKARNMLHQKRFTI